MGLSEPWAESLLIITPKPVIVFLEIKPMGRSAPLSDSIDIIVLDPVNNNC